MQLTTRTLMLTTGFAVLLPAFGSTNARAALITGVTATASTQFGGREASKLTNNSGISGTTHDNNPGNMWLSNCCPTTDTNPFVVFDLGAVYTVNSFQVWNYNENSGNPALFTQRGVNAVKVEYGNLTFGSPTSFESTVPGVTNFAQANGLNTYAGQVFNAFAPFNTRYVKFDIDSRYGADSFGLSEVRFDGVLVGPSVAPVEITGVTVASVTSQFVGDGRLAVNTVNGSGLNILGNHSVAVNQMWLSNNETLPEIVYDLGAIKQIGLMEVWNYNEAAANNNDRGIKDVKIFVSNDNVTFTELLQTVFTIAPNLSNTDFSQLISLNTTARFVKLDVLSNYGDTQFTGLSEVKFFSPIVIPEPATASLALMGLGGLMMRRRRMA